MYTRRLRLITMNLLVLLLSVPRHPWGLDGTICPRQRKASPLDGQRRRKSREKEGSPDDHSFAVSNHELVRPRGFKTRMQA